MKEVTDLSIFISVYELRNYINDMLKMCADDHDDHKKDTQRYAIFSKESIANGDPVDIIYMNKHIFPIKESSISLDDLMMELIFGKDKDKVKKHDMWCSTDVYKNTDNNACYDLIITIHNIYATDTYKHYIQSFINNLKNSNKE